MQKKKKICNFLKITQRMNLKFLNLSTPSLSGNNERVAMVRVLWERAAMAGVSLLLKPWNWFQISSYLIGGWICSKIDISDSTIYHLLLYIQLSHIWKDFWSNSNFNWLIRITQILSLIRSNNWYETCICRNEKIFVLW